MPFEKNNFATVEMISFSIYLLLLCPFPTALLLSHLSRTEVWTVHQYDIQQLHFDFIMIGEAMAACHICLSSMNVSIKDWYWF